MHLGLTTENQSPGHFFLKVSEPGIRSVIYIDYSFLKLDQVDISLC